jgi:hypothetical protein
VAALGATILLDGGARNVHPLVMVALVHGLIVVQGDWSRWRRR